MRDYDEFEINGVGGRVVSTLFSTEVLLLLAAGAAYYGYKTYKNRPSASTTAASLVPPKVAGVKHDPIALVGCCF